MSGSLLQRVGLFSHTRSARRHDNLVDGEEDQLDEEAQEAYGQKANGGQTGDLEELLSIRLFALLQQPGWMQARVRECACPMWAREFARSWAPEPGTFHTAGRGQSKIRSPLPSSPPIRRFMAYRALFLANSERVVSTWSIAFSCVLGSATKQLIDRGFHAVIRRFITDITVAVVTPCLQCKLLSR